MTIIIILILVENFKYLRLLFNNIVFNLRPEHKPILSKAGVA